MMADSTPRFEFHLAPVEADGFPIEQNESYQLLLDQALSGGAATDHYLSTMLKFADLANYLNETGLGAYTIHPGVNDSQQGIATNGVAVISINVFLNDNLDTIIRDGIPICGLATVTMALPGRDDIIKFAQFGITLAEIPIGIIVTRTLWEALFAPLIQKISKYVQTSIENWLAIDVGDDVTTLGNTIASTTSAAADEISEEVAQVTVEEEVVAELTIDLAVAGPAFAVLGVLIAIPLLIKALEKTFIVHLEVNNVTATDFEWSVPYWLEGTMTAEPATTTIPKIGRATDMWGDQTDVPVVFQAYYSSTNQSGFQGIGFVIELSPAAMPMQSIAAVIAIPWLSENSIWVGDPGTSPNWQQLYNDHCHNHGELHMNHGNQAFYTSLAIDALTGNQDEYHLVLQIEPLGRTGTVAI